MWHKFKCFIGWHDYVVIRYSNLYKGDMGMYLKCRNCQKEKFTDGLPMM